MVLRKATKQKSKLRIGLSGVSGSGKTYSALLMASGMTDWSKIALIDTENGSGDLYSDLGEYNVFPLIAPFTPEKYIQAVKMCEQAGMEVIIIDSITHEWDGEGGLLEEHSKLPGNSYANWAKIGPRHTKFIQAILKSPCHIITTVRRKQDYEMVQDSQGKTKVVKLGMKEVTREGFEYELTTSLEININHQATSSKDRTGLFVDQPEFIISHETGKKLLEWCNTGADPIPTVNTVTKEDSSPTQPQEKKHLKALQVELQSRGATSKAEALEILNFSIGTAIESFDITEEVASEMLIRLLQKPKDAHLAPKQPKKAAKDKSK